MICEGKAAGRGGTGAKNMPVLFPVSLVLSLRQTSQL